MPPEDGPAAPPTVPPARVVPLGRVSQVAAAVAAAHLGVILGLPAEVAPAEPMPENSLLLARRQHDAQVLLQHLDSLPQTAPLVLGLTEEDLCLPVFTFVLGEAWLGGGRAVVSLHRLRMLEDGERATRALAYQRLAKVACHEAGHALGLTHCRRPGCLMRFSHDPSKLDMLGLGLCPDCLRALDLARSRLT